MTPCECGVCELFYHSFYSLFGEKGSYIIQAFPSSLSFLLSKLPYLQRDSACVSSWCGAAGADPQRWLFGAEDLICQGIYIRLPPFWFPGTGLSLQVGAQEVHSWRPSPGFLLLKGNPVKKIAA